MSGNFVHNNCRLVGTHLTATTDTTIYSATGYAQAIGIRVANITAGDVNVTLSWYSNVATDEYRLIYQHAVPANSAIWFPLEAFSLNSSDELRAQASAANALDVIVSISEVPGRSG